MTPRLQRARRVHPFPRGLLAGVLALATAVAAAAPPAVLETPHWSLTVDAAAGRAVLRDRTAGVEWGASAEGNSLGNVVRRVDGKEHTAALAGGVATVDASGLTARFEPWPDRPGDEVRLLARAESDGLTLVVRVETPADSALSRVTLFPGLLAVPPAPGGAAVAPVREGLLIPSDSGPEFSRRFETYAYEGCHLAMFGWLRDGAALLAWWSDPELAVDLRRGKNAGLETRLELRGAAREFRLRPLGRGEHNAVGRAYREEARALGWWVPWSEKIRQNPDRARLQGAINFKLWSLLHRSLDEESRVEREVRVNWTFDQAAQIAEHLRRDLRLERVLFILGGWIHRGYDNQHPDILPAAPECGGDAGLADCARRVREAGFTLGLHDNYQDIYRDSPSWNEDLLQRTSGGAPARGGVWAGGRAYLTCSTQALALARRPQNLPAVRNLVGPAAYFIDTTYAVGLQECFSPAHPLDRRGDLRAKQALSDYARGVFGMFGSECGREWAVPHADFFEGITGVGGRAFHDAKLEATLGAFPIPLFEMVYRDTIAAHGKYGYDPAQAGAYVLWHLLLGRPLHYHSVPRGLYWQTPESPALDVLPGPASITSTGPDKISLTCRWQVEAPPAQNWRAFVHFTDGQGRIRFQADHAPKPGTMEWAAGDIAQGPFAVRVPADARGEFAVRAGFYDPASGNRARLRRLPSADQSHLLGVLTVTDGGITFAPAQAESVPSGEDPGVFVRGDQGWSEGMHPHDRFVKNTAELLSPLHELTAETPLTRHEFLRPDRSAQRSVFGEGANACVVTVNYGPADFETDSDAGGRVVLPPFGFVVESPRFLAFHARAWSGLAYADPPLFTLRAAGEGRLGAGGGTRVFHGFGDARLRWCGREHRVGREAHVPD